MENYGFVQMKMRVEDLENDQDDIVSGKDNKRKTLNQENRVMAKEFCKYFKETGKCNDPFCDKAHNRHEFDPDVLENLVSDQMKLKQLKTSIKVGREKIMESTTVKPWMYTGNKVFSILKQDTIENAYRVKYLEEKAKKKNDDDDEDSEERRKKENKRNIYEQNIDQIGRLPFGPIRSDEEEEVETRRGGGEMMNMF